MKKLLFLLLLNLMLQAFEDPSIQTIVLKAYPDSKIRSDDKIQIIDLQLPASSEELRHKLSSFLGKPLTKQNLLAIKETIFSYFTHANHPMITVEIPEQKISQGVVSFVVIEPKISLVSVSGNRWLPTKAIQNRVAPPRTKLDERTIQNNLAWLNQNPFLRTDAIFFPGSKKGTTDMEVVVQDRFPLRLYAGVDDTGSDATKKDRFFGGFNLSCSVHTLLSYQFTSSVDFPDFLSHYGNLTSFLPWKHKLIAYGAYATIHPDIQDFDSSGTNSQASLRYEIPLNKLYRPFQHSLLFGYDFKQIDSALFFLGATPDTAIPVSAKTANLSQFYLGYRLDNIMSKHHLTFNTETFFSPFTWLPDQSRFAYNAVREDARPRYLYGRTTLGDIYQLPKKFSLSGLLRLQAATDALLPSEQFGLGGFDTVRGYDERVFLADNAVCLNMELLSPPLSLFSKTQNTLRFLIFTDYAWGHNYHDSFAEGSITQLYSIGPGLRYNILPYLTARLDYGFQLHKTEFEKKRLGRFHFSVIVGY